MRLLLPIALCLTFSAAIAQELVQVPVGSVGPGCGAPCYSVTASIDIYAGIRQPGNLPREGREIFFSSSEELSGSGAASNGGTHPSQECIVRLEDGTSERRSISYGTDGTGSYSVSVTGDTSGISVAISSTVNALAQASSDVPADQSCRIFLSSAPVSRPVVTVQVVVYSPGLISEDAPGTTSISASLPFNGTAYAQNSCIFSPLEARAIGSEPASISEREACVNFVLPDTVRLTSFLQLNAIADIRNGQSGDASSNVRFTSGGEQQGNVFRIASGPVLDFGDVLFEETVTLPVRVENTGTGPCNENSVAGFDNIRQFLPDENVPVTFRLDADDLDSNGSKEICPGSSGIFNFIFEPREIAGFGPEIDFGADVDLVFSGGSIPNALLLTGTGVPKLQADFIALEVIQVVQDLENSVQPLVADKATLVRAYLRGGDDVNGATVDAHLYGNHSEQGELGPISARSPIDLIPDPIANRNEASSSLIFELPSRWYAEGFLDLRLEDANPDDEIEFCATDGSAPRPCIAQVQFRKNRALNLKLVALGWTNSDSGLGFPPPSLVGIEDRLLSIFPVAPFKSKKTSQSIGEQAPNSKKLLSEANAKLKFIRTMDECSASRGCNRLYYGVLPRGDLPSSEVYMGLAADIPGDFAAGFGYELSGGYGRYTAAHEIGHLFGRLHAVGEEFTDSGAKKGLCGSASFIAPTFPYIETVEGIKRPTLGPLTPGSTKIVFGYDFSKREIVDPTKRFELMSYCGPSPRWISRETYLGISGLLSQPSTANLSVAAASPAGDGFMLIRGILDLETNEVEFLPFGSLSASAMPDLPPAGAYELELLDGNGLQLERLTFEPTQLEPSLVPNTDQTLEDFRIGLFLIPVSMNAAAQRVQIRKDGALLAEKIASPNAPAVTVTAPNGGEFLTGTSTDLTWAGNDLDDDALTYVVEFSSDAGITWDTLAVDLDVPFLSVDLDQLGETVNGLIRVTASDGFRTTTDTSDGVFTIVGDSQSLEGDIDQDGDVDRDDLEQVLDARNKATDPLDPRDINGDGQITIRDGRLLILRCTESGCDESLNVFMQSVLAEPEAPSGGGSGGSSLGPMSLLVLFGLLSGRRSRIRRQGIQWPTTRELKAHQMGELS